MSEVYIVQSNVSIPCFYILRVWKRFYIIEKSEHIKAAYPPLSEGLTLQTKERRVMPMYVTFSENK